MKRTLLFSAGCFLCMLTMSSGSVLKSTRRRVKASMDSHDEDMAKPLQYVDVSTLNGEAEKPTQLSGPKTRQALPECAAQQVCNALFARMNHSQSLCECSKNYGWECNSSPNVEDGHTIELTRRYDKKVYTQVKMCEPLVSVRTCKVPTDWTILALQSERTGKAHYVVVCKCPDNAMLEGPYTHNHPPYARIPGIRVYGMLCSQNTRLQRNQQSISNEKSDNLQYPDFPWDHAYAILNSTNFENYW